MRVAIMQPTYLGWMGYFSLIDSVDTFVFHDDVKYNHQSWQQRNRIKTENGPLWLTVPVLTSGRSGQLILEAEINEDEDWEHKHRASIETNYASASHFSQLGDWFDETYAQEWTSLCELNEHVVASLADQLGLESDFVFASELDLEGRKAHKLVKICHALGADEYLSPLGSRDYIESNNPFPEEGVDLCYQHYEHPTYRQLHGKFMSHLSIIDLLLNEGADSLSILREGQKTPYTHGEALEVEV